MYIPVPRWEIEARPQLNTKEGQIGMAGAPEEFLTLLESKCPLGCRVDRLIHEFGTPSRRLVGEDAAAYNVRDFSGKIIKSFDEVLEWQIFKTKIQFWCCCNLGQTEEYGVAAQTKGSGLIDFSF